MVRRKSDEISGQPDIKRVRTSLPVFRVARASASTTRTSRVTTIRRNARGRRGHSTDDKVHSPDPAIDQKQQPEAGDIVPDPPMPYLEELDDPAISIPLQPPKAKRTQKNTTSVSSP